MRHLAHVVLRHGRTTLAAIAFIGAGVGIGLTPAHVMAASPSGAGCPKANLAQGAPQHVINNAAGGGGAPQSVINNAAGGGAPQSVINNAAGGGGVPQNVLNNASGKAPSPGGTQMAGAQNPSADCN